ncbi:MAG TPA: hypothetical protein VIY70_14325 [Acidimicrobiia bacterium]
MSIAAEERRRTVIRTSWGFFANSIIAAGLAVVFARVIEQFGLAIGGVIAGRDPVLTNIVTEFRADGSDLAWLGAPIGSLVFGSFFLMLYPGAKDRSVGKLLMLWTILFCFRNGFLDLATMTLSETSYTAMAVTDVALPAGVDIVIAVAGAVGLLLIAIGAAPAFLGFNRHLSEVDAPSERLRFVSSIAMVPALVGPLLAVPFLFPDQGTGYLSAIPLIGVFVVITVLAAPGTKHFLAPQLAEERVLSFGLVVGFIAVFLFARFVLEPGILIPPWDESFDWHFRP